MRRQVAATSLGVGFLRVALVVDVGVSQAVQRGQRIVLRECRHAPRADRGADQLHWRRRRLQPLAEQQLVERDQRQALGPAGRRRDAGNVGRRDAVLAHVLDGAGAGAKREHRFAVQHG